MHSRMFPLFLTIMAVIVLAVPMVHASKEEKYQGRQHGYDHGYRDGYQHGREDRERHLSFKFETDDYKHGDRGYDKYMGDHDDYKQGYRSGYQNGYNDAFYSRPGRFAEIYGREDSPEVVRDRYSYVTEVRPGGYPDIAFDIGYRDGVQAGAKDLDKHEKFDPADHDRYRDGDHDYQNSYGSKEVYKRSYREGYIRGYQDGYGRWR